MIVAAELVGEMACKGLIIPSAVNPGKPSRPAPSGQGHSSGRALYLDRWDLARTLGGRVDGRRDDQQRHVLATPPKKADKITVPLVCH